MSRIRKPSWPYQAHGPEFAMVWSVEYHCRLAWFKKKNANYIIVANVTLMWRTNSSTLHSMLLFFSVLYQSVRERKYFINLQLSTFVSRSLSAYIVWKELTEDMMRRYFFETLRWNVPLSGGRTVFAGCIDFSLAEKVSGGRPTHPVGHQLPQFAADGPAPLLWPAVSAGTQTQITLLSVYVQFYQCFQIIFKWLAKKKKYIPEDILIISLTSVVVYFIFLR